MERPFRCFSENTLLPPPLYTDLPLTMDTQQKNRRSRVFACFPQQCVNTNIRFWYRDLAHQAKAVFLIERHIARILSFKIARHPLSSGLLEHRLEQPAAGAPALL